MSRAGLTKQHEKKLQDEVYQWLEKKYNTMTFNEYQKTAITTAVYPPQHRILYPALGLSGEAGEVANKVKKIVRDGTGSMPDDWKEQIGSEIGDVLWYCATLANDLGLSLSSIAEQNQKKLQSRKEKGTIHGSGDSR
tara:strand:- start:3419 stop:3829 length:411 start_codon:yes stop_codon:yes gene_type:complete